MGSVLAGDNAATPSPYDFALGGKGLDPSLPGGMNGTLLKEGYSVMVDIGGKLLRIYVRYESCVLHWKIK